MPKCPTCGREDFKSEHGLKIHHARAHGESLTTITRKCSYCDSPVEVYPSRRGKNERVFCTGSDCYSKWQSENRTGENNARYKGKTKVECANCGSEKEIYPWHAEGFDKHFCSTECESEWKRENTGGEQNANWVGRVEVTCDYCGTKEKVPPWRSERYRFCSRDCQGSWMSENLIGESSPNWRGGKKNYGKGWNDKKKEAVRERDDHACQHPGCSVTNEEHKERTGRSLHVHHIQNKRDFDDPEERNDMDNLVTLCMSHHRFWEQLSPLRPDSN